MNWFCCFVCICPKSDRVYDPDSPFLLQPLINMSVCLCVHALNRNTQNDTEKSKKERHRERPRRNSTRYTWEMKKSLRGSWKESLSYIKAALVTPGQHTWVVVLRGSHPCVVCFWNANFIFRVLSPFRTWRVLKDSFSNFTVHFKIKVYFLWK